jgi:hypothetical protein
MPLPQLKQPLGFAANCVQNGFRGFVAANKDAPTLGSGHLSTVFLPFFGQNQYVDLKA